MQRPILKVDNVSHQYATAWAIRDIDFEISKRGIYGLLGSNGAGKSTTMNIVCGVLNQTHGVVYIDGVDSRKEPLTAKAQIGFLPQHAPLYLDLTVKEYLLYASRLRTVPEAEIATCVDEVMVKCGVSQVQNRLLKNLSGGYRQRVGIAQAIVHKPKLVVLDEPMNGLDPVQIIEVRNLIRDIAQERTVILSSHILTDIQILCSEIIMIEQGRMVFSDTMEAFNNYVAPQSMLVEFENAPAVQTLEKLKGVQRIERLTAKQYRIFFDGTAGLSESIIVSSVQENWRLTQLTVEKNSIDEIFKQLTKTASH